MGKFNVLNLQKWINENRDQLKPPVSNKMIWEDRDFIVMVVGGPNSRTDYHVNQDEEFFYQLEGEMCLRIINDEGDFEDISITAGEIFLLPSGVPHSPQRMENSIGLVIEHKRDTADKLQWYCSKCKNKLFEEEFNLKNIETAFGPLYEKFFGSLDSRTCSKCGEIHPDMRKR